MSRVYQNYVVCSAFVLTDYDVIIPRESADYLFADQGECLSAFYKDMSCARHIIKLNYIGREFGRVMVWYYCDVKKTKDSRIYTEILDNESWVKVSV